MTVTAPIGTVDLRSTVISTRLLTRILNFAVDALVPDVRFHGDSVTVSAGVELAGLYGVEAVTLTETLLPSVLASEAVLRKVSIKATSIRTAVAALARRVAELKVQLAATSGGGAAGSAARALLDHAQARFATLDRRDASDIALHIRFTFVDPTVTTWFDIDVASLENGSGEIFLIFNASLSSMTPIAILPIEFTTLGSLGAQFAAIWSDTPSTRTEVEEHVEKALSAANGKDHLFCRYTRDVLTRAVGIDQILVDVRHVSRGWKIRHHDIPTLPENPPNPNLFAGQFPVEQEMQQVGPSPGGPDRGPAGNTPVPAAFGTWPEDFKVKEGVALDRLDKIETLVVVMMENRSFDHMLGDLPRVMPRPSGRQYDGLPPLAVNQPTNPAVGPFVAPIPTVPASTIGLGTVTPFSPHHSYANVWFQIGSGDEDSQGSGAMQGFTRDAMDLTDAPQIVMSYYQEEELPVWYHLARRFMVCDRWFSAVPAGTYPNRWAAILGDIPSLTNLDIHDPHFGFLRQKTIFDVLTEHDIEWRYLESDFSLIRMFDSFRLDDRNVLPLDLESTDSELATLLKGSGPLPRVIFIEPNFVETPPLSAASDDHAPADLANGQAFIAKVCNLLFASPHWDKMTLLITYDEHGGFYDHVAPPGTLLNPVTPRILPLIPGGPECLGVRVPAYIVSPFVKKKSLCDQRFDHTSILKTILVHNRKKFRGSTFTQFGARVNAAPHLGEALQTNVAGPRPALVPLPSTARAGVRSAAVTTGNLASTARTAAAPRTPAPDDFHAAIRDVFKPHPG